MTVEFGLKLKEAAEAALDSGLDAKTWVKMARVAIVVESLNRNRGNQCKAAKSIEIHRNTVARVIGDFPPKQGAR